VLLAVAAVVRVRVRDLPIVVRMRMRAVGPETLRVAGQ
jgi:hypothetical protein